MPDRGTRLLSLQGGEEMSRITTKDVKAMQINIFLKDGTMAVAQVSPKMFGMVVTVCDTFVKLNDDKVIVVPLDDVVAKGGER